MDTREAVDTFRKLGNSNKLHRQIGLEKKSDLEAKEWLFKKFGLDPDDDDELFWEFRLDTPCISIEEADAICDGWIAKVVAAERVTKGSAKSDKELDSRIDNPNSTQTIYKGEDKPKPKVVRKDLKTNEGPKSKLENYLVFIVFLIFIFFTLDDYGLLSFMGIN